MLSSQQNLLLQAIINMSSDNSFEQQGLAIYQSNFKASAIRTLAISYPSIYALIGDDNFATAATEFIKLAFKSSGDWGEFGEDFPTFLANQPALESLPFIGQLARLDWAVYRAERAEDKTTDLTTLTLLSSTDPYHIKLNLASGLTNHSCDYAVDKIRESLLKHKGESFSSVEFTAGHTPEDIAALTQKSACYITSFRQGFKGHFLRLSKAEFTWLDAVQADKSLGECLDCVADTNFDVQQWLANAIEQQLLVAVRPL